MTTIQICQLTRSSARMIMICGFCLVVVDGWYFGFVLDSVKKDEKKVAAMLVAIISKRNSTIKNCAIMARFISK